MKLALGLDVWTSDERRVLEDEKLKTNPYTRLFTLAATKAALRAHFDDDQNIVSGLPESKFKSEIERIARDFLIPDPANSGKPKRDTRSDPNDYFAPLLANNQAQAWTPGTKQGMPNGAVGEKGKPSPAPASGAKSAAKPPGAAQGAATQPQTPKASVFFENLLCHVQDDILLKLSGELRSVNHAKMPVAASLLLRATFEAALVYRIKKAKKWGDVITLQKQGGKPGRDPGLSDLINFASNHGNGVFIEQNMCKTLNAGTTKAAKDYLDAMTHLKFQEADPPTLVSVANNIRGIIQYILNGN